MADFTNNKIYMTAEQVRGVSENRTLYNGDTAGKGAREMAEVKNMEQAAKKTKREELTIKFAKGLAEAFVSKEEKGFIRIRIPNQDPEDKTPWASFVLPEKAVHENQYGKGLWAKIPAEGTTIITKPTQNGWDDKGRIIWQNVKTQVPNRELKAMVETYKSKAPQAKESAQERLGALVKDAAAKTAPEKPKAKVKEPER